MKVIVCPMQEELGALLGKLDSYSEADYGLIKGYKFDTKRGECFAFVAKIGKTNIGFDLGYLASKMDIEAIFNIGVGGSLDPTLVPLNVVVADKVCYYDCDLTPAGDYLLGQMADNPLYFECDKELVKELTNTTTTLTVRKGTIISGDSFGTHKNMTAELLKHFDNPLVVDMESAACGQVALRLNVPFVVIRSISDNIIDDEKRQADIYEEYLEMSAKRAASVLVHYLNKDMLED